MIKQTKKRVFALLGIAGLIGILSIPTVAQAPSIPEQNTQSKVAEQKSVIEEQAIMLPYAGVSFALGNNGALKLNTLIMDTVDVEPKITEEEPVEEIFCNGWTNARVNVRTEPNTDSEILTTFKYNTAIEYTNVNEEWVKIKYEDDFAYLSNKYISDTECAPLSPYADLIDTLTDDEKYLIYQITFLEAGNQSMEGQRAVIEVILNRVLSDKYPNTVERVLSQSGQFVTWAYRNSKSHNEEQEKALQLVYEEEPILTLDYLMFSKGKFSWGRNYIKIGDHWFGTF